MLELYQTVARVLQFHQEVVWLTIFTGVVTAGLTATYINLPIWKGMAIGVTAIVAAAIALPWMHPLWSYMALRGGVAGLDAGAPDHTAWIGASCVAGLAAAGIASRVHASVVETMWIVCVSALAMWTTHQAVTQM